MNTRHPLLFLDIDGVLHPASSYASAPFSQARLLADGIQDLDVRIILSSSWRFSHGLSELKALLPSPLADRLCGATGDPCLQEHARYHEILEYRASTGEVGPWRALDDSAFEFPKRCPELILCNANTGVAAEQVVALRNWLQDDKHW
jgi:hypothetical protein